MKNQAPAGSPKAVNAGKRTEASDNAKPEGFAKELGREVAKGVLSEAKATFKWGVGGAVVGAIVLGGAGAWKFGGAGLLVGGLAGALLGAIAGVVVYAQ